MSEEGYPGWFSPSNQASEFNSTTFLVKQLLALLSTATLVQVKAVTNSGGISPVGTVDVQPLVKLIDATGQTSSHGVIYKLPYFRLQGGADAIIIDPQVDDIGLACFADRDISSVKANKAEANPGSFRRFNMSDGLYLGGFLNGSPTQYVRFFDGGINVVDRYGNKVEMTTNGLKLTDKYGHTLNMNSAGIALIGDVGIIGNVNITGTVSNNGVNIGSTHVHGGVTAGAANTAVPH